MLTEMRDITAQTLVGIPKIEKQRTSKHVHHETVVKRTSVKRKPDL